MSRISKDEMFLQLCFILALRGTCVRRKVGCVLIDKRGHIISTGYNGNAAGLPHCIDEPCSGANLPSGTGLNECEAIHAEQNALIQCIRPFEIDTVYCTDSPCVSCVKLLMGTSAKRVVFSREYPHSKSKDLWLHGSERIWQHIPISPLADYYNKLKGNSVWMIENPDNCGVVIGLRHDKTLGSVGPNSGLKFSKKEDAEYFITYMHYYYDEQIKLIAVEHIFDL